MALSFSKTWDLQAQIQTGILRATLSCILYAILKSDAVHRYWVTVSFMASLGRHHVMMSMMIAIYRAFCQRIVSAVLQCHIAARSTLLLA